MDNLILMTDSYKAAHPGLYPEGTHRVYCYGEARGGAFPKTLFFGLQYYLRRYLAGKVVTKAHVEEAADFWGAHFGRSDVFDRKPWDRIVDVHGGFLPIRIDAVPEGTLVPVRNPLWTVESTDRQAFWLPGWLETLLMKLWYPTTIATQSYHIRQSILGALEKSGDPAGLPFKCHDFGYRGVSSEETAALGAAAHLVSFMGTDTVAGIRLLRDYYYGLMTGFSIPATEHSIMCAEGREGEARVMARLLDKFPTGLVACVSDTYDLEHACRNLWGKELKDKVLAREGCLVVRPDSGDFYQTVLRTLEALSDAFGSRMNGKGYRVLNDKVRVIQGDGMDRITIQALYSHLIEHGWSADNLAVGSGGGLLQKVDRDTCKMAYKASAMEVDGAWRDVHKEPKTDPGKLSKRGRFHTWQFEDGSIGTLPYGGQGAHKGRDLLVPVFENGDIVKTYTIDEIRTRAGVTP